MSGPYNRVPGTKFVGLTMLVSDRPSTAVFTDPESPEIDQTQYDTGHGPCLDAFRTGRICVVPSTKQDNPWPEFSAACLAHGILSTLSLPLAVGEMPLGAMNLYAPDEFAYDGAQTTALLFSTQASIVLANAQAYWDARSLGEPLSESIASRAVIEQAKGIIMGSMRCGADEAFDFLVKQSQHTNTKLRNVAQDIVDDVAGHR
ncbi:MAG: GAF and ANTAR domain-containing protein [Ilumatobacteraceae bacterium]